MPSFPCSRGSYASPIACASRPLLAAVLLIWASAVGCDKSESSPTDAAAKDAPKDNGSDAAAGARADTPAPDSRFGAEASDTADSSSDRYRSDTARTNDAAPIDGPGVALADAGADAPTPDVGIEDASDAPMDVAMDAGPDADRDLGIDGGGMAIDAGKDGTGEAGSLRLVTPTVSGTVYTFSAGTTVFAVDTSIGARVVTYSVGGKNVLTTPAAGDASNYGSTFWTSPQSDWNWPPPSQIDPGPYTGGVTSGILSVTSATASALGVAVSKAFSMDGDTGDVTIQYGITNKGTKARAFAPWEISRVAAGGLTFFPMGEGTPQKGSQDLLKLSIVDGVAWLDYDAKAVTSDQKVFADGAEGWIAHVSGNLLLVKAFGDTTPDEAAPSETEIELFTNAGHTYIEVENQGAYASIPANTTSVWTVRWFLRKLDPSVSVAVGSSELLTIVRGLVRGG